MFRWVDIFFSDISSSIPTVGYFAVLLVSLTSVFSGWLQLPGRLMLLGCDHYLMGLQLYDVAASTNSFGTKTGTIGSQSGMGTVHFPVLGCVFDTQS